MHPTLTIAIRAARKAGNLIAKNFEIPDIIATGQKGLHKYITNIDCDAKHLLIAVIRKSYPQHTILAKEYSEFIQDHDIQWIINPLDSTSNFIKRFPHCSVSIAVRIKGRTEVAVVYDPIRNELFTASRGYGAQLNGYRLRGQHAKNLEDAILATGYSFKHIKHNTTYIKAINALFTKCADVRRTGSSVLDLAYVAAGRIDGFCESNLKPWEFAASELLVRESGGVVTDFIGDNNYFHSGNIVASNSRIVQEILSALREE